jgi:type 1 fimbriae regulatory protein FimB
MTKTSQKPRRAQQNWKIVAPTESRETAGHARAPRTPQATKRRPPKKEPVCLTLPEKARFFSVIKSARDKAAFGLCFYHGLRVSELRLLMMSDYREGSSCNLDRLRVTRLKGSISGETAVVPECAKLLRAWIRRRGRAPGALFPSRQRMPLSRHRLFRLMQRYGELAQLPPEKRHPHALRHSCATMLLVDQGEPVVSVQQHLGHASIQSTMKYISTGAEYSEARIRRLQNWR